MSDNTETWSEWSKFVLKELERLNNVTESLKVEINEIKVDVAKLQVKASIWGGVTGLITTLIALSMYIIKG